MKLAILILNWNGKALLKQFLPTVVKYSSGHSIVVVDNASSDDSVEFVSTNFSSVRCIELDQNYGYAGGYNRAIKQINADFYCLINSDVRVTKHWIDPILNLFKINNSIDIIQPKILDEKCHKTFEYAGAAGGYIDQLGYPYCRGRLFNHIENDFGQYDDLRSIFWASGACFFIRSSVFKKLGGFDDRFFAHMEEIDLCWRAYNAGHSTWYTPESTVYHVGGASLNAAHPQKTYFNFRNSLFSLTKNSPHPLLLSVLLRLLLDGIAGFKFLFALKPRHTLAILRAHLKYYLTLPKLIQFRRLNKVRKHFKSTPSIVWSHYILRTKTFSELKQH